MDGPPKVGELDLSLRADQQILGFDVTVNDVLLVTIVQGVGEIDNVFSSSLLGESNLSSELLVELAAVRVLKNEVDTSLVEEISVHSKDVSMTKVALDLNLATQLVLDVGTQQLRFSENFNGDDPLGRLLSS